MRGTHGLAYALLVFFVFGCVCGKPSNINVNTSAPPNAPSPAQAEAPVTVTAAQLVKDYEANEIAADGKYKDKTLLVSGVVDSIQEMLGQKFVTLRGGGNGLTSVQCFFGDAQAVSLSNLKGGQRVSIQGRCDGKSMNVTMQECVIK